MNRIFVIILAVICCTACQRTRQQENTFFVDMDRPEKASLFDYFRSVELIPLETNSDALVKSIGRLFYCQDKYYFLDMPQAIIFVFDRNGKYLFKIDKHGKGPGEYSSIEDIHINSFTNQLNLLTAYGFVYQFDLSGNFVAMKRMTYPGFRAVHQFAAVDSDTYIFYSMFQPKKIICFDLNNDKLLYEEFEESQEIGSFGFDNLYSWQDHWYFYRPFHTCVYRVGQKGLEEVFRFDFGKYTREGTKAIFSEETRHSLKKLGEEAFAQFPYWIRKAGHNNRYVFAQIPWGNVDDRSNIVYDKTTRQGKFIPVFDEKVEFEPNIVTDEYVLSWCTWSELEKRINRKMLDTAQNKIFDDLMQSKIETNPVLIKYWFK